MSVAWPFLLGEPLRTKRERQMNGRPELTPDEMKHLPEADLSRQGRFQRALNARHKERAKGQGRAAA